MKRNTLFFALALTSALAGCKNDPVMVASNEQPLEVNQVDILLVVDNSGSMQELRDELPALLDDFVAGSDEPGMERPKLTDIHLAVVTTDMSIGVEGIPQCEGAGDDAVFVGLTAADIEECSQDSTFLAYEDGVAAISTTDTVECLPSLGLMGCGFEQPLEAMLKSMWPASDTSIEFMSGPSHGEGLNEGFLREDSLLVVIVVTDEDDCSIANPELLDPMDPSTGLDTRCAFGGDDVQSVERYVDGLRALREGDDPMLFVLIGGVPPELVDADAQAAIDFSDDDEVEAFYDSVLEDSDMQIVLDDKGTPEVGDDNIRTSCVKRGADPEDQQLAFPPRRLVEVAKRFGNAGVLGSICAEDFAETMGGVIRATAERL